MPDEASITDLLQQVQQTQQCEQATTDIYQLFLDKARAIARKRLDPKLKGRVTASTIAHEALGKCIDRVMKMPGPLESRDDFAKMLTAQIKRRLADAGKQATAQKRDVGKETATLNVEHRDNESWLPDSKAMADELAVEYVQNLFQEPDEIKRMICVLGILLEHKPSKIQEMIQPLYDAPHEDGETPRKKPYAKRSIELIIAKREKILQDEIGGDEE